MASLVGPFGKGTAYQYDSVGEITELLSTSSIVFKQNYYAAQQISELSNPDL